MKASDFYGGTWIRRSRCWNEPVDPEMFFNGHREEEAKEFCKSCPVRVECKNFATSINMDGVAGGLNERQRRHRDSWQRNRALRLAEQMKELLQGNEPPSAA